MTLQLKELSHLFAEKMTRVADTCHSCSERLARSQVEGKHQKEACSINKSLSSLGDVFSALASKQPYVPYRNSKLTHLLQVITRNSLRCRIHTASIKDCCLI